MAAFLQAAREDGLCLTSASSQVLVAREHMQRVPHLSGSNDTARHHCRPVPACICLTRNQ